MVDEALTTHSNDTTAHELPDLRTRLSIAEGLHGTWTRVAADTFSGANGVLTTTETGGLTYTATFFGMPHRDTGVAVADNGVNRGATVETGASDGQIEAELIPGTGQAGLLFRFQNDVNYLLVYRAAEQGIFLIRHVADVTTAVAPGVFIAYQAGETIRVRFIGERIWVWRVYDGVETLIFDLTEATHADRTKVGFRLLGTGSIDNFAALTHSDELDANGLVQSLALKAPLASPTFTGTAAFAAITSTGSVRSAGGVRATGLNLAGWAGLGGELLVYSGAVNLNSYNRTTAAFALLNIQGSKISFNPGGTITLTLDATFGNFANDAAAATGGVPVKGMYRNGSVLMVRVA